jgi:type IV secretory pathway TrbF-like protein
VDWVETARDLFGGVKSTDHWKGSFMIALNSPTEERQARINPLGLYVTAASWAKVL